MKQPTDSRIKALKWLEGQVSEIAIWIQPDNPKAEAYTRGELRKWIRLKKSEIKWERDKANG